MAALERRTANPTLPAIRRSGPGAIPVDVHQRLLSDTIRHAMCPSHTRHARGLDAVNVLGLNAYHGDVSAVLVRDGRLVAAVEEERFRRIKHVAGFPSLAIAECLGMGGISGEDVDLFDVTQRPSADLWS
jgi:hypothetical protein